MSTSTFALIFGIAYLAGGVLGLIPAALQPPPPDAPPTHFTLMYGYLLGLFPVNVLHSAVHLAIGVWGLSAWRSTTNALVFARVLAIFYGALAVMGIIPGMNTLFGALPIGVDALHRTPVRARDLGVTRGERHAEERVVILFV